MYQQTQQLPVPFNQVDTSTFNASLPNNNDAVPQVQLPKFFQQNQQTAMRVLGIFRKRLQDSAQKSAAHVVNYNILSQNRFQNHFYQIQCQRALDLAAILVNQMQLEQAINQAAVAIAEGALGTTWATFRQQLFGMVPQQLQSALDQAAQRSQQIDNQINQAKQQASGFQQQPQQFQQQFQQHAAFASTTTGSFQPTPVSTGFNQTQNESSGITSGMYAVAPNATPVQEFDTSSQLYQNVNVNPKQETPMYNDEAPEFEYIDIADIVIDPEAYPRENPQVSIDDPYGLIHVPGGVVIEPAFRRADLTVTVGDDNPYTELYDPKEYIEYYVQYADGVIKSKVVKWTDDMEYLKHEIDAKLRGQYAVASDTVVVNTTMVGLINETSTTDVAVIKSDIDDLLADSKDLKDGLPTYLILDQVFTGVSDLDNEMEVKEHILETFNVDEPVLTDVIPPHEYLSMRTHTLDIDAETAGTLATLATYQCYIAVSTTLHELLRMTDISIRNYNFINKRITAAINEFLKDSLSSDITIDDFVADIADLISYLKDHRNPKLLKALESDIRRVLKRAVTVEVLDNQDEGTTVNAIVDNYVNLQTSWMLSDLRVVPFKEGETTMISRTSDKTLLGVIKALIQRHKQDRPYSRFRIVTLDGVYLEIIRGHLIDNAMLLKRL